MHIFIIYGYRVNVWGGNLWAKGLLLVIWPRVRTQISLAHSISQHMALAFWPFHKPTAHRSSAADPDSQEMHLFKSSFLQRKQWLHELHSKGYIQWPRILRLKGADSESIQERRTSRMFSTEALEVPGPGFALNPACWLLDNEPLKNLLPLPSVKCQLWRFHDTMCSEIGVHRSRRLVGNGVL